MYILVNSIMCNCKERKLRERCGSWFVLTPEQCLEVVWEFMENTIVQRIRTAVLWVIQLSSMPKSVFTPILFACIGTAIPVKLRRFVCLDLGLCLLYCSEATLGGRLHFQGSVVLTFHFVQSPVGKPDAKWIKDAIWFVALFLHHE